MFGKMTVFGFGREYPCCDGYMDNFPSHFTIGFNDDLTYAGNTKIIDSSYQDLQSTIGSVQSSCGSEGHLYKVFLPAMIKD